MTSAVRRCRFSSHVSTGTDDLPTAVLHDSRVSTPEPFPCPNCHAPVIPGSLACPSCDLRLVGPQAVRLWQVNQHILALRTEADQLVSALLLPPTDLPLPAYSPYPAAPRPSARKPLTGQQILLGLGAVLLLSGVSFFLLVVWILVGLIGQAAIMVTLTGAAAGGAMLASRRGLPAAAVTGASIATGLLVIDLWAAHHLNLAGLGNIRADGYWAVAGLLGAAVLLGFDRLTPKAPTPEATRPGTVYRPAAATLVALSGWALLSALDVQGITLSALALVLALVSVAAGMAFSRLGRWAAAPLLISALGAAALHLIAGASVGYDPSSTGPQRYTALVLLLVLPVLAIVTPRLASRPTGQGRGVLPSSVAAAGVVGLLPALGIAVVDADRIVLVVLAVFLAATLIGATLTGRPRSWSPAINVAQIMARLAQPALFACVLLLVSLDYTSGRALLSANAPDAPSTLLLPVLPAVAWAASALVASLKERSANWAVVTQVAVLCALVTALRESPHVVWVIVALVACAASYAVAGFARSLADSTVARLLDYSAVAFALLYGGLAVLSSLQESPAVQAGAWFAVGVPTLIYAGTRDRLQFAYLGSLLVSAGTWVLLADSDVTAIEAYTAPLALLLAAIGVVQYLRDGQAPTLLTMGPALTVALVPSLAVALEEGGALRLAAVTLIAITVLVVGLLKGWRAPVTVGGAVLVIVAVYRGGPYIEYVPGWIILVGGGALLLTAGVAWERAVLAGRRAQAWYSTLR